MNFPRICIFSLRNFKKHVWRCALYEFEDVISEVDDVDLLLVEPSTKFLSLARAIKKLSPFIEKHFFKNASIKKMSVNKNYEAFVFLCQQLDDLQYLKAIDGWKKKCKISVVPFEYPKSTR